MFTARWNLPGGHTLDVGVNPGKRRRPRARLVVVVAEIDRQYPPGRAPSGSGSGGESLLRAEEGKSEIIIFLVASFLSFGTAHERRSRLLAGWRRNQTAVAPCVVGSVCRKSGQCV